MAMARGTLEIFRRHADAILSRSLTSLAVGDIRLDLDHYRHQGHSNGRIVMSRDLSTSRSLLQESSSQLAQADMDTSDPAPGLQFVGTTASKVPRFTIIPAALKPSMPPATTAPILVAKLDSVMLAREMSNFLSHGKMEEAVLLFEQWIAVTDAAGNNPNLPDILAYNLLLHAKLRIGVHPDSMYRIITEMETAGVHPTQLMYNFVLRALFRHRNSRLAEQILEKMEVAGPEAQPNGDSYNFVIALCALDRRVAPAVKHIQAMCKRGLVPSAATYIEVLLACARSHQTRTAVTVLKELKGQMMLSHPLTMCELAMAATETDDSECALLALQISNKNPTVKPSQAFILDEGSIMAILGTAARTGNAALAKEAWDLLKSYLNSVRTPGPAAYAALLHAWSSSGDLEAAFSTLREMQILFGNPQTAEESEVLSPFTSLRPLVVALSRAGPTGLDAAYFKLAELQSSGQQVPLAAVNCVILGCANVWDADRAYQTFDAIGSTFGLTPDVHSINALLDAFGKNRKIQEAVKLFEYLKEASVSPNQRSYELLIIAHVVNRDPQSAFAVLTAMMEAGHTPCNEVVFKLWRRCRREGDLKLNEELQRLFKVGYKGEGRRRLISAGVPQGQGRPVAA